MQHRFLHLKSVLPKYLFAITLLLSSLVFSGYTGNSKCSPERMEQEELSEQKSEAVQKVVPYKKAFVYFAAFKPRNVFIRDKKIAHSDLDRRIKVRLFALKKEIFSFVKTACFTQLKTFPSAPDEDVFML